MAHGICALCGRKTLLKESHIIPKFVIQWLKKTSATGHIRDVIAPNRRIQDLPREYLLCAECEGRFSYFEKQFSEKIFLPYKERKTGSFAYVYEEWLLSFIISLSWRTLRVEFENFGLKRPALAKPARKALAVWGSYLLEKRSSPGSYVHHLFFMDYIKEATGVPVPKGFHSSMLRATDSTIASSEEAVFVYSNLCGMIILSAIAPRNRPQWRGTRVFKEGVISSPQHIGDGGFLNFLLDRANEIYKRKKISERQHEKIAEAMQKNPERLLSSESIKAIRADAQVVKAKNKRANNSNR